MNKQNLNKKPKVLLLENINPQAVEYFKANGCDVTSLAGGLDEDELIDRMSDIQVLGIRSKTTITERILDKSPQLLALGAFCIGTKHIDQNASLLRGIPVFNAPYSNTRSVVELTLAEIMALSRNMVEKSYLAHSGRWEKSARGSHEVRGKTLGIVGYGNIGSQLSILAEALGIYVIYYDIEEKLALGNARKCNSLRELLKQSDFVSIHVDDRPENEGLIGAKEFKMMSDGVIFINSSRGKMVDLESLVTAMDSGKVRGAAIDVFPYEPKTNQEPFKTVLQGLPNVILTPHIGGSTEEAQQKIATFVPQRLVDYLHTGDTSMSVNFPQLQLSTFEGAHRFIHLHRNEPGVLAQINHIFASRQINILGQYLKTNEKIGYMIADVSNNYSPNVIKELEAIDHTIRFRVLY